MMNEEYREFPCDLCGNWDAVEVPHSREYQNGVPVHICTRCGFVYVKMRRSAERIAESWSDEIFGDVYTAHIPAMKARLSYVADFINVNLGLRNKRVCDIGAGEGVLLDVIRVNYGAKSVFGIEPAPQNCQILKGMGIDHYEGTIEEYINSSIREDQKVDIVTITWTLENCQSCKAMLGAAYQIIDDGGSVVVATGSRILVPFKKPLHLYLGNNPADTNAFRFSANTLRGILAICNFEVTHVNRYIDSDVLCMIAKKANKEKEIKWEGDNYLDVYNFFERWHVETTMYYSEVTGVAQTKD